MREQRVAIISDLQVPYHSAPAVANVLRFLSDWQPTSLVNVGDDIDCPQVSTFGKGLGDGEYAGTLQQDFDACREIHRLFRQVVGDISYSISRSNHSDRWERYLTKYAPALAGLRALDLRELLGYNELAIKYFDQPFPIAPGWVACHGDEGNLSKLAGRTAAALAAKFGVSVACGHTHRLGVTWSTCSVSYQVTRALMAMEVGNLMNLADADYLKGGSADWQSGIGLLYVSGDVVQPVPIPITETGSFVVEGVTYG